MLKYNRKLVNEIPEMNAINYFILYIITLLVIIAGLVYFFTKLLGLKNYIKEESQTAYYSPDTGNEIQNPLHGFLRFLKYASWSVWVFIILGAALIVHTLLSTLASGGTNNEMAIVINNNENIGPQLGLVLIAAGIVWGIFLMLCVASKKSQARYSQPWQKKTKDGGES